MPYVITNGSSYIRYLPNNTATTTTDKQQARIFQSEVRAQNSCVCLPNVYRKMGFYVTELYTEDQKELSTDVHTTPSAPANQDRAMEIQASAHSGVSEELLDFEFLIGEISRFEDLVISLTVAKPHITELLRSTEMEILDIEHIAEFGVLNAPKAYKVYKKLHDARRLRRKCKDCLTAIGHLNSLYGEPLVNKQVSKTLSGMTTRKYEPRVLTDFYEEICGTNK